MAAHLFDVISEKSTTGLASLSSKMSKRMVCKINLIAWPQSPDPYYSSLFDNQLVSIRLIQKSRAHLNLCSGDISLSLFFLIKKKKTQLLGDSRKASGKAIISDAISSFLNSQQLYNIALNNSSGWEASNYYWAVYFVLIEWWKRSYNPILHSIICGTFREKYPFSWELSYKVWYQPTTFF